MAAILPIHAVPQVDEQPSPDPVPLVVDLDGSLLRGDLLLETAMAFARTRPLELLKPLGWFLEGKAALKEGLATATQIDVSVLPYDPDVMSMIEAERRSGRKIVLATASHRDLAERVAAHLNVFDEVLATDRNRNLSGERKRDLLVEKFGRGGFDYIGNASDDIAVWANARRAYVVNPKTDVERRALAQGNVERVIHSNQPSLKAWMKALRLHQWMKNVLIFVPLLAAHKVSDGQMLWQGLLAFLLFGLCASSVYILNDLLDLADDRHHRSKRNRPFASGRLSILSGLIAWPALLLIAFGGAVLLLPMRFAVVLLMYYALTLAYSLVLKRKMAIDVIALAMLYTMRIIAGAAAVEVKLTFWMLAFSMFMFLSLALVKRYPELQEARNKQSTEKMRGRGYFPGDLEMLATLGTASGYLAVMVLALYIHDMGTEAMYTHPELIWLACPLLLYWITRIWMLTHRGLMHDDPVVFAVKDRISLGVGALFCFVFWLAL